MSKDAPDKLHEAFSNNSNDSWIKGSESVISGMRHNYAASSNNRARQANDFGGLTFIIVALSVMSVLIVALIVALCVANARRQCSSNQK
jgi:heme/copper-type cytochrome/quinol oxidase subunit 2